jgi:hypothetical protein
LQKLRESRKWKYNLEKYMNREISTEEADEVVLDEIFFEKQTIFVED